MVSPKKGTPAGWPEPAGERSARTDNDRSLLRWIMIDRRRRNKPAVTGAPSLQAVDHVLGEGVEDSAGERPLPSPQPAPIGVGDPRDPRSEPLDVIEITSPLQHGREAGGEGRRSELAWRALTTGPSL